jgi:uncharacterized membrane protein YsdA (DUF1294 family)
MDIPINIQAGGAAYLLLNLFSFSLMLEDKRRSRKESRRISEGGLLFAALAFGALGAWAGMYAARHKTQKMLFLLGVPLALLENLATLYLFYLLLSGRS